MGFDGGALSGYLFIIAVCTFLQAVAAIPGVEQVWGFCDDWTMSMVGLEPIHAIHLLVQEFECASGQRIHRTKSVWIPTRTLAQHEIHQLNCAWPEAKVVEQQKCLGVQFGSGVTPADIVAGPLLKFGERIVELKRVRVSMSMRIFAANTLI